MITAGSDDAVLVALKAFVHQVLPALGNRQVVTGQQNNVPMPPPGDFIVIVPNGRYWLSTSSHAYRPDDEMRDGMMPTRGEYNINFYGPSSPDYAQSFAILWRDIYACDALRPADIQPLWASEARQMPLIDDAKQYEDRWLVQTHLQFNATVSTAQQFAGTVALSILEAD